MLAFLLLACDDSTTTAPVSSVTVGTMTVECDGEQVGIEGPPGGTLPTVYRCAGSMMDAAAEWPLEGCEPHPFVLTTSAVAGGGPAVIVECPKSGDEYQWIEAHWLVFSRD